MMIDLSGKTALVTGGGQGLGRVIATVLARQGADVAIGDIDSDNAEETAGLITDSGRRSMALILDVSSRKAAKMAVDQIVVEWGAIDILVNNAGVVSASAQDGETVTTEEEWAFVLGVNLNGVVNCTDAALPHMSNARYGKIINIASTAGISGDPLPAQPITVKPGDQVRLGGSAYAASKAAVIRHTQIVASSAAPFNINVNTVCPSRLITPMGIQIARALVSQQPGKDDADLVELRREAVRHNNRFNRELEPVDIGNTVAFLASDDARNITGQSINVDGGFKMT